MQGEISNVENRDVLKKITETWHLEARQESREFFFYIDEVGMLREGKKCYVIGRKGMGKTAISEYLYKSKEPQAFSERLSFNNFPQ